MRIKKPEIVQVGKEVFYSVKVESKAGDKSLWFSLQDIFGDLLTSSCDAPLLALLIPAMARGEDIHVDGTLSERLWYNLSGPYQKLVRHVIPWLHPVKIYAGELQRPLRPASGVATGFSGGIDSYCVLADHYFSKVPDSFKVTHLLFNNVGSHGKGGERLFRQRYARLEQVVERIGLPIVMINSNMETFYGRDIAYQQTHTTRIASAALLLQGGIGRYMYASAHNYASIFVGETYDMAFTDAISLPLMSTEAMEVFAVGSEYTRVEKIIRVADLPGSYTTLDVCVNPNHVAPPTNCSTCWKCMRTLLTLDIAGMIDRYSASFDLELYYRHKSSFIARIMKSEEPLLREVITFAEKKGYSFPLWSHFSAPMFQASNQMKKVAKRMIRTANQRFSQLIS